MKLLAFRSLHVSHLLLGCAGDKPDDPQLQGGHPGPRKAVGTGQVGAAGQPGGSSDTVCTISAGVPGKGEGESPVQRCLSCCGAVSPARTMFCRTARALPACRASPRGNACCRMVHDRPVGQNSLQFSLSVVPLHCTRAQISQLHVAIFKSLSTACDFYFLLNKVGCRADSDDVLTPCPCPAEPAAGRQHLCL